MLQINLIKGLISNFKIYKENDLSKCFELCKRTSKWNWYWMYVSSKRQVCKKRLFDEINVKESPLSLEESNRVQYSLYIVDDTTGSLGKRFEHY